MALRVDDDGRRVRQPCQGPVLMRSRRQGAWLAGAVGGDDVDVLGAVEDPVLTVETGEEALDFAWRLPADVFGLVAGVAGTAGEGDPPPVGRPCEVAESVGHGADRAQFTRP